jgi:hypothetical protein
MIKHEEHEVSLKEAYEVKRVPKNIFKKTKNFNLKIKILQ